MNAHTSERIQDEEWLLSHMATTGISPTAATAAKWMGHTPQSIRNMFKRLHAQKRAILTRGDGRGCAMTLHAIGSQFVAVAGRAVSVLLMLSSGPVKALHIARRLGIHPRNARTLLRRMVERGHIQKVALATYALPEVTECP